MTKENELECRMVGELKRDFLKYENYTGHITDRDAEQDSEKAGEIADRLIPLADKYGLLKSIYAEGLAKDSFGLTRIVENYLAKQNRTEELNKIRESLGINEGGKS